MKILQFFGIVLLATIIGCTALTGPIYKEEIICIMRIFVLDSIYDAENQLVQIDTIFIGEPAYSSDPRCPHNQQIGG